MISDDILAADLLIEMYERMLRIRLFEERVGELAANGQLAGTVHLSIGQEATCVGTCLALQSDDYMTGNHRSHGHPIAKGANLRGLMAELFGRRTGVCKGKGGSMHLADFSVGSLGESGVVAAAVPIAVGAGLSAQVRGTSQVCAAFFGDGAVNQGIFHESLNFAGIWSLPVIFVCENNSYAMATRATDVTAGGITDRARAYGIPATVVDGQDVVAVYKLVRAGARRARDGDGPTLVEALTYRYREHAERMPVQKYRSAEELEEWVARDPVRLLHERVLADGIGTVESLATIRGRVAAEVDSAVAFAQESPYPEPDEAFEDVYADPRPYRSEA